MEKKQLTILIIAGALIFLIGGGLGVASQLSAVRQKVRTEAFDILSSKVITSVSAYGKVTKIEGRDITLNNLGDNLSVSMPDNVKVYSFVDSSQQAAAFEDIKIGDSINATLKLLPTGGYEGLSIIIFPAS